jgi:hypothetical protein
VIASTSAALPVLAPDEPIRCVKLHAIVSARVCALRQRVSEIQRTTQLSRGQGGDFPSCTERCAQGAAVKAALGPAGRLSWRGSGPGHRFAQERCRAAQYAARGRLEAIGLLDVPPSIDEPPGEIEALLTSDD